MNEATKSKAPFHGSGKTQFHRGKASGESWTARRDKSIKAGNFKLPEPKKD